MPRVRSKRLCWSAARDLHGGLDSGWGHRGIPLPTALFGAPCCGTTPSGSEGCGFTPYGRGAWGLTGFEQSEESSSGSFLPFQQSQWQRVVAAEMSNCTPPGTIDGAAATVATRAGLQPKPLA